MGVRYFSERPMVVKAMPMDSAQIQEEICPVLRPAFWPAWNISTRELV
ncbi:hypothetical protein Q3H58_000548 [Pseudomonas psychrotolerans]|nr:hypothetical protein [Pseudomonas psychrotolerans]